MRIFKVTAFCLLLACLLFIATFPLKSLEWGAAVYCKWRLGANLSIDHLSWQKGRWIVKGATLTRANCYRIKAKELTIRPKKWLAEVEVNGLSLNLSENSTFSSRKGSSIHLPISVTVRGGKVSFGDERPLDWNLIHVNGQGGKFAIQMGKPLEVVYSAKDASKRWALHGECEGCDLAYLSRFAHHVFHPLLRDPALNWRCSEGTVDGSITLTLSPSGIEEVEGALSLEGLEGDNPSLSMQGAIRTLSAQLHLDLRKNNPFESCFGSLEIEDGHLSVDEAHPDLWEGLWDLHIARSRIQVADGKVEHSQIDAHLFGMTGELALDWSAPDALIGLHFSGSSKEMRPFLPTSLQTRFAEAFPNDAFSLNATVKRLRGGLELEGSLEICDEEGGQYPIAFGCHFGDSEEGYQMASVVDTFVGSLKEQFHLSHRRLGWFRGSHLPLIKFLSPFLLHDVSLTVEGMGDFEGTFDDNFLIVFYQFKDFLFQGQSFSLSAGNIDRSLRSEAVAVHYINLDTWDHVGFLPIKKATYTQKNMGWTFTDGSGIVQFDHEKIYLKEMSAKWENLQFEGELDIAIHSLDNVDLWIRVDRFDGPLADSRRFLSHLSSSILWDLPLDGRVLTHSGDVSFHYTFEPRAHLKSGRVRGFVQTQYESALLSVEKYGVNFDYDYSKDTLSFAKGDGHLRWRDASYDIKTPSVVLSLEPKMQISLGLELLKEGNSLITLAGETTGDERRRDFVFEGNRGKIRGFQEGGLFAVEGVGQIDFNAEESDFSFDLSALSFLAKDGWVPKGMVNGCGNLRLEIGKGLSFQGRAHIADFGIGPIDFGKNTSLNCLFSSESGLVVEGLAIEGWGGQRYDLGRLHYHLSTESLEFEEIDFSLPQQELAFLLGKVGGFLPEKVSISEILALKGGKPLEGTLSAELFPKNVWACLKLKKGDYFLADRKVALDDFSITYDPLELSCQGMCTYLGNTFWCRFLADSMTLTHGKLMIGENEGAQEKLTASWERQAGQGWHVRSVQGEFSGLSCDLVASEGPSYSDELALTGRVGVDGISAARLFPKPIEEFLTRYRLGKGYVLQGDFSAPKEALAQVAFDGKLFGDQFHLGGIQFNALEASAHFSPGEFELTDLSITDWAGSAYIEHLHLLRGDEAWALSIPSLHLSNIRPAHLRRNLSRPPSKGFKQLLFPACHLYGLSGSIGKKTTFKGAGDIQFTRIPKKNFLSNLLYIPTEITARIGLDLSVLIPARGTVGYEIRDGRIYLTEFKEMYSEGKRSRFYLAGGSPAYVDFDGNLNMKVKMKQYNLLMKLAEFFTVTVKGTIFKPSYTLMNQFDDVEEGDED